jgi:HSP20 family molecular chaperone IbpA
MKGQATEIEKAKQDFPIRHISMDSLLDRFQDVFTSIERRAYEIFDHDGRWFGRDLEHWLRAEAELFHPLHLVVKDTDHAIKIRAEVPGFTAKDLEISVEPRRLVISGKREAQAEHTDGTTIYSDRCSDQIFRVFDLPADAEPSKAKAAIEDGMLELEIPKTLSKGTTMEIKSA